MSKFYSKIVSIAVFFYWSDCAMMSPRLLSCLHHDHPWLLLALVLSPCHLYCYSRQCPSRHFYEVSAVSVAPHLCRNIMSCELCQGCPECLHWPGIPQYPHKYWSDSNFGSNWKYNKVTSIVMGAIVGIISWSIHMILTAWKILTPLKSPGTHCPVITSSLSPRGEASLMSDDARYDVWILIIRFHQLKFRYFVCHYIWFAKIHFKIGISFISKLICMDEWCYLILEDLFNVSLTMTWDGSQAQTETCDMWLMITDSGQKIQWHCRKISG